MNEPRHPPQPGDHAPQFSGYLLSGSPFTLEGVAGRPLLLVFIGGADAAAAGLLRALAAAFDGGEVGVLVAVDMANAEAAEFVSAAGVTLPVAPQATALARLYGAADRRCVFVLDRNLRVLGDLAADDPAATVAAIAAVLGRCATMPALEMVQQAPVLLVPAVLSAEQCRQLIQTFETGTQEPSGSMKEVRGGKVVEVFDAAYKNRTDVLLTRAHPVYGMVRDLVGARVLPEIRKAFHCDCRRIERFVVARYDAAAGGYFRPHRDNTTPATAHRRFAMTLNLNTEEHEGGHLRFPEYAPHRYRPPTGDAIVFSGSLLHEATDVTRGVRYTLLSFFYTDADQPKRTAYLERHGSGFEVFRR